MCFRKLSRVSAILALIAAPAVAWAHTKLLHSEPGSGATLSAAPTEARLVFSERPELGLTSIRLVIGTDTVSLQPRADPSDSKIIVASIDRSLDPGAYAILWRVAGRDGHAIHGTIPFSVEDSVRNLQSAPVTPVQPDEHSEVRSVSVVGAVGFILVRWAAYLSLFILVGAVVFKRFVLPRAAAREDAFDTIASTNAATLGMAAAAGVVITGLLKLARESADMPDMPFMSMLLGSTWATSVAVQIVAGIIAVLTLRLALRSSGKSAGSHWSAASLVVVIAAIAPAFSGHAMAGDTPYLAVPADIVHILAGSAWLGTLAVIVLAGIPAAMKVPDSTRPAERIARMINAFSPMALMCGGAVVATGLGSAFIRLPSVDALWTTAYGSALFRKLVFVLLLFGVGAWNWRRIRPRLGEDSMLPKLSRSASTELVIAVLVLGFTAVLVAIELP